MVLQGLTGFVCQITCAFLFGGVKKENQKLSTAYIASKVFIEVSDFIPPSLNSFYSILL